MAKIYETFEVDESLKRNRMTVFMHSRKPEKEPVPPPPKPKNIIGRISKEQAAFIPQSMIYKGETN